MVLALTLALLGILPAPTPLPIRVEALARETPEGPVRAWLARVDLNDPRVSFVVTGPMERREGDPERAEARLVPTDVWAEREGVDLAVNASFFARLEGSGAPVLGWTDALPVDLVGLSRSEGRTVSPPRRGGGVEAPADPALLIDESEGRALPVPVRAPLTRARAISTASRTRWRAWARRERQARARFSSRTAENLGATAQVAPTQRHPRTAAGVSRDGRTLLLLVVDGRQPGWSIGATLPELAQMMLDAGAWNAVNLDGGGSSAMWHREPGATAGRVLNRPSDGHVRPVANHLGVRLSTGPLR